MNTNHLLLRGLVVIVLLSLVGLGALSSSAAQTEPAAPADHATQLASGMLGGSGEGSH